MWGTCELRYKGCTKKATVTTMYGSNACLNCSRFEHAPTVHLNDDITYGGRLFEEKYYEDDPSLFSNNDKK
jgi:hypothetical protein